MHVISTFTALVLLYMYVFYVHVVSRAIHHTGTDCLRLLLKPDMTYFKDHRGRTVIHLAAKEGAMAACELIVRMRPDAIFDTDKQVLCEWAGQGEEPLINNSMHEA